MLTDCNDCNTASLWLHHGFTIGCVGCSARAVARSPEFAKAFKIRIQNAEYLMLLKKAQLTHPEAKEAARNDRTCDKLMGVT